MNIKGKKIVVVGGKRSGMALARLIVSLGGKAKISEQGPEGSLTQEFQVWASGHAVALEFNGHTQTFLEDADLLVLSPGVRFNAAPVQWAKARGIPVLGEIEFAAQFCDKPIIAVTGSNGKTTVSTLIKEVLERAGKNVCLCGNIGQPFSGFVLDLDQKDYVVLEISSFQLESVLDPGQEVKGFRPHIAVLLNFSQNHLDRHKDLQEYWDAKKRIFLNQSKGDFAVLNASDPRAKDLASQLKSQVVYFNSSSDGSNTANPNHLAVLAVGEILGIDAGLCRDVFKEFKGVEHRLEKVRSLDGVEFINDSKATTVEAAGWALKNIQKPVVLICGGRDKNVDFRILTGPVREKVKKIYTIGEAMPKIKQAFGDVTAFEECEGLEEAVNKARASATEGDCVLLSPMCASFDMFTDYEHRGRVFKKIVHQLT